MQSNGARAGVAAALIAIAVVLFVALSGGDDDSSSDTTTSPAGTATIDTGATGSTGVTDKGSATADIPTIVVKDGKPVGGIQELTYDKGDQVKFRVESDVADEVHLHGYDIGKDVEAGGSVTFDFTADIDGIYEAEVEQRAEQILELRINP